MSPTGTLERNAGLEPITAELPGGGNPRESDSFSALQAQIDRLTDIHTNRGVDWNTVASLAVKVLRQEGKDLSVAAWLTMAWFHLRGLQGLADGAHVLKDLVQTYWESMSPPASRLRGRRNQMQWLLDQLTEALQGEFEPMPGPAHAGLMADWEELDIAWQTHDDDSPAFYALRRTLEALPVEPTSSNEAEMVNTPATTPHQAIAAAPAASPLPPPARPAGEPPPGFGPIDVPAPDADPETEIDTALAGLRPLIDWCLEGHPKLPLLFRLNRICAWASLTAPPPASGNETHVPPPPDQMVTSLELLAKGDDAAAVVQFIETRLVDQHFWLDLNRICHSALTSTGASDAAATVAFETTQLVQRLPGLSALTFNDGRPFADAATQVWLNSLAGAQPAQDNSGSDTLDALKEKADSDAASGKLDAALNVLQSAASQANSARNAFRLRLAQCDLLYRFDAAADLRPLLAPLIHELDTYQLLRWEPELARRTLELAAAIEQRYGADPEHPPTPMLARLASLDCHAAWRLIQPPAR